MQNKPQLAIIGAGVTGLTLTNALAKHYQITVFEKSRGLGGRLSTRYSDDFQFDHGAPYFHAPSSATDSMCSDTIWQYAIQNNAVQPWQPTVFAHDGEVALPATESDLTGKNHPLNCWVATPKMNQLGKTLAQLAEENGVRVVRNVHVETLNRQTDNSTAQWQLTQDNGADLGMFDWVVSTAPMEQAHALLPSIFSAHADIAKRPMQGCYSLMLGWEQPPKSLANATWDVLLNHAHVYTNDRIIKHIVRENNKPHRTNKACSVLVQTTPEWADQHIDGNQQTVQKMLVQAASKMLAIKAETADYINIHRWRYAGVATQGHQPFYLDTDKQLAAAGDWCLAGNVASAITSAYALAATLQTATD